MLQKQLLQISTNLSVTDSEINRLTTALAQNGNRLRDLVHLIATSEIFLQK